MYNIFHKYKSLNFLQILKYYLIKFYKIHYDIAIIIYANFEDARKNATL